jgi:hypothetical protein
VRTIVSLLVGAVLLVAAVPAQAAVYNRVVATRCSNGTILAVKVIDNTQRNTGIPCFGWVPNLNKPQDSVGRPTTDVVGAGESAARWWSHCARQWNGAVDHRSSTGWFYTYFKITCP